MRTELEKMLRRELLAAETKLEEQNRRIQRLEEINFRLFKVNMDLSHYIFELEKLCGF